MSLRAPEISLISSWCITPAYHLNAKGKDDFPALRYGLRQQVRLFDLYFLDHGDVGSFALAAGRKAREGRSHSDPLRFASSLKRDEIEEIAKYITTLLAGEFRGPLVGPRPRITALATHWPLVSLLDSDCANAEQLRSQSILAVQNSLTLAAELGCRHVEIVGGSGVPESEAACARRIKADEYRRLRFQRFARSLHEILKGRSKDGSGAEAPFLTIEVEPGDPFLIKDVASFVRLKECLSRFPKSSSSRVLLNVDIAHMMLAEGGGKRQLEEIRRHRLENKNLIGHMHASDHSRTHASDLVPGTYHFYDDFRPWISLAHRQTVRNRNFSRCIAVEMEACNDVHEVTRALSRIRRWNEDTSHESTGGPAPALVHGAILVADIGNSTSGFFGRRKSPNRSASELENRVANLCRCVHGRRGSVLSFTGDGVIAHFDVEHFLNPRTAAKCALEAARNIEVSLFGNSRSSTPLSLRVALHWGSIHLPGGGPLRHQAIGRDVVLTCRLCDWLAKSIETAVPESCRGLLVGVTSQFVEQLDDLEDKARFGKWGDVKFKGLERNPDKRHRVTAVHIDRKFLVTDSRAGDPNGRRIARPRKRPAPG